MKWRRCEKCGELLTGHPSRVFLGVHAICWGCAAARLPNPSKKAQEGAVKRCKCVECGFDAPVWVESEAWLCRCCRPKLDEEE